MIFYSAIALVILYCETHCFESVILLQTFLVWQILLSIIFLGRRYRANQLLGCFLVAVGVIITVAR